MGESMRIALVCPYDLSTPGGVQSQVLLLARALRARGHDVRILAPWKGVPPRAGCHGVGLALPVPGNGSIARIALSAGAMRRTWAELGEGFDVVHVHEPLVPGAAVAALARPGAPVVATFHRCGRSVPYGLAGVWTRRLVQRIALRCAVSDQAASTARSVVGGDFLIVPNAVDPTVFPPKAPHDDWVSVAFVGRHERRKGLEVLLEAFARLPRSVAARLLVAGHGPETERLSGLYPASDRLAWLGRLSEHEKLELLANADIVCVPSLGGESFGVVLLEAMAAGAAVLASELPSYKAVAEAGKDALFFAPGDAAALTHGLEVLIGDPSLRQTLGESGRHRASLYSPSRLAQRYELAYRRVLGIAQAPPQARGATLRP